MRPEEIRVLFFGTPLFARVILESLYHGSFDIIGVITQPTKRSGRGLVPLSSAVKEFAEKYHLLVYQPYSTEEMITIVKNLKPDLILSASYGKIIPEGVLALSKHGSLNVHASLLPKYRGPSPIATAILNGDEKTGITVIEMTKELDSGPIVSQSEITINSHETTETLYQKLAELGSEEALRVLPLYVSGEIKPIQQNHSQATYCEKIRKEDGLINWREKAVQIEHKIRALIPWPHAYTNWVNQRLILLEAKVTDKFLEPGFVVIDGDKLFVGTSDGSLEVVRLQIEGKLPVNVSDFINGYPKIDGATLK